MYRMGTGDCFALKFFSGREKEATFRILIDAGSWSGKKSEIEPYITNLKKYLGEFIDVLVITHEHKDHVHAFDCCEDQFTANDFKVGEIWFGWTENDKTNKVKDWKKDYGEKKKALGLAARQLEKAINSPEYKKQLEGNKHATMTMNARKTFSNVLSGFADLHMSAAGKVYKGGLDGMEVVKTKINKKEVRYFMPGDTVSDMEGAEGIKFYVLGPPKLYEDIKKEKGVEGESYLHNDILRESGAFGAAVMNYETSLNKVSLLPFDEHFVECTDTNPNCVEYDKHDWRKIDFDWMFSAGSFALRMNGLTNNLSLALAIELEDSGKVLLFPGDAEYGSWASWHNIEWTEKGRDGETPLTEDLLNRTVFYKVAHHLSHNGTAQRLGLNMMKSKDLVAMATLDYNIINEGWTSTMPNRAIVKELLAKTKGRLMIMNEEDLFYDFNKEVPLKEKIEEARSRMSKKEKEEFDKNFEPNDPLYLQYTLIV